MNAVFPLGLHGSTELGTSLADVLQLKKKASSVLALLLFGSRARGDHNGSSDTDILLMTNEARPRQGAVANISLSFYPFEHLQEKSKGGDLFVCHLIREAKVISDENGAFDKLRNSFCVRDSYDDEINSASELGWFLTQHSHRLRTPEFINRRIAWCVRTIMIAHSVQSGSPCFSADRLEAISGSSAVGRLIRAKNSSVVSSECLSELSTFLSQWGAPNRIEKGAPAIEYLRLFRAGGNGVALQTVRNYWSSEHSLYI